jgi:hypothetical protein
MVNGLLTAYVVFGGQYDMFVLCLGKLSYSKRKSKYIYIKILWNFYFAFYFLY